MKSELHLQHQEYYKVPDNIDRQMSGLFSQSVNKALVFVNEDFIVSPATCNIRQIIKPGNTYLHIYLFCVFYILCSLQDTDHNSVWHV